MPSACICGTLRRVREREPLRGDESHPRPAATQTSTTTAVRWALALQQSAGNRATTLAVQRQPRRQDGTIAVLRFGAVGKPVKILQQQLNAAGAEPVLRVDGIFLQRTRRAVRAFQRVHHLPASGVVAEQTWAAFHADQSAVPAPALAPQGPADPQQGELERVLATANIAGMTAANSRHSRTSGIWYDRNYERAYGVSHPEGYADGRYWELVSTWMWRLRPGVSASAGLQAWLRGLTIAECASTMVAIHLDSLRVAIGDHAFDRRYGSADASMPESRRLVISGAAEAIAQARLAGVVRRNPVSRGDLPAGEVGDRPNLRPGQWWYFRNHPAYPLKHPHAEWRGENALYLGRRNGQQMWSGLGAADKTEREMLVALARAYNRPATHPEPEFRGPRRIDVDRLVADGGGLQIQSGAHFVTAVVEDIRRDPESDPQRPASR